MSWEYDQSEHYNAAKRRDHGYNDEFEMDQNGMVVTLERGYGYSKESCRTTIPLEVLIKLIEHQGYYVEFRPS